MSLRFLIAALICVACCRTAGAGTSVPDQVARLRACADSLHSVGRTDSAVIVGEKAVALALKSGDPTLIVGSRASQGVFLRSAGDVDGALRQYEEALSIVTADEFRRNPDQEAVEEAASLYINLAVLNLDTDNKEAAAADAALAADWVSKSNDRELRATVFGVAGSVMTGCGDLRKAMRYQDLAYRDAEASGDRESAFRAAAYAMLIASRLGNKADEDSWRGRCVGLLPEMRSVMAKLVYYQAECSISLSADRCSEAIDWFQKILSLDGIDNLPFVKFDCYNNMHAVYAELGDYSMAYNTVLKSNELRDSLWENEKAQSLRDLSVKYETKEKELALARSEASRAHVLIWLFALAGLLMVGVVVFVVYWGRQRRRRMQRELEFANLKAEISRELTKQYVEGLENERQRMARELHDGVCNDLLAIRMEMGDDDTGRNTAELLDACRENVRRISHELMPPEFSYANIDEVLRYFLCRRGHAASDGIHVSYSSSADDASWNDVEDSVALEIYRIVQEAVGNARKHSSASAIDVELTLADGMLCLTVKDNGTFKSEGRKGLGLESIRRRGDSIGAAVSITCREGEGSVVEVRVPVGKR